MEKLDGAFTDTRKRREKIKIDNNNVNLDIQKLDVETLDSIFILSDKADDGKSDLIFEFNIKDKTKKSMSKTSSTCSSRSSNTSSESNCENSELSSNESDNLSENASDNESEYSSIISSEFLGATINNFPVQVICLEELEGTLDSFLEKSELSQKEWVSCLFQIIMKFIN